MEEIKIYDHLSKDHKEIVCRLEKLNLAQIQVQAQTLGNMGDIQRIARDTEEKVQTLLDHVIAEKYKQERRYEVLSGRQEKISSLASDSADAMCALHTEMLKLNLKNENLQLELKALHSKNELLSRDKASLKEKCQELLDKNYSLAEVCNSLAARLREQEGQAQHSPDSPKRPSPDRSYGFDR